MLKKLYFWEIYGLNKIKGQKELQQYDITQNTFNIILDSIRNLPFDKDNISGNSRYHKDKLSYTWQLRFANELVPNYKYGTKYDFFYLVNGIRACFLQ